MITGPLIPPGWTYNPSSWMERLCLIGLALLDFAISGYLALYQWGLFATVWEPFFDSGSEVVLHSGTLEDASHTRRCIRCIRLWGGRGCQSCRRHQALAHDALGSYCCSGWPWGPLGLVSVLLVMAPPLLLNAWCTLRLISAVMIDPAMDEY